MTPVGERSAARAQVLDQGLKAGHARVESYFAPVSVGSIDARSRIFAQLWLSRLTRVRACTGRRLQSGTALDRLRLGRIENCCGAWACLAWLRRDSHFWTDTP